MTHLDPIPAERVEANWHFAEPWVRSAVEAAALLETVDSYRARCLAQTAQLWLIRDDCVIGAAITEVYDSPKGLTCAVPVVAAVGLDEIAPAFDQIEAWAKAEGCVRMEGCGRLGWVRALQPRGWRPLSVVVEKDI